MLILEIKKVKTCKVSFMLCNKSNFHKENKRVTAARSSQVSFFPSLGIHLLLEPQNVCKCGKLTEKTEKEEQIYIYIIKKGHFCRL